MRHLIAFAFLGLALAGTAFAADDVPLVARLTPEQLHATGLDTLTPQQLAALDAVLRAEQSASRAAQLSASPAAPTKADALAERERSGSLLGLSEAPINARLQGAVAGWEPGTVFTLDNGQQWKVLKGEMKLRKPLDAPEVVVAPGLAGRWFLQLDPDLPKARVYRID
jgi:hypothetical protein